ncbi:DNA polymerase III subunit delta' [Aureimonas endophytica]|uniref:DNA polymerase III subunit delta n=1 Tax=Aureimonas endophytica TaxID=2027858 RepID=A0A916ZE01_9HYPH|nr:DNA polymerase III subunit delta' [Aureimonas endophytica]GGD89090.1 DNA polymerase III subunit delta' [Aureimonas endophytica]
MSDVDLAPAEHDALEGVPSPAENDRLRGHEAALAQLLAAHRAGRLHHAWLLQGPRGIGKATLAFAVARQLLGGDDAGNAARQIASGSHPNLLHLTRAEADRGGFKTQITVDEVRKLNRFFQTTAGNDRWRIAIVDPADDLNRNAANALLKTLEEPPDRSLFLIVNHLPGRLLPTIRSRCRVLRLDPLPAPVLTGILDELAIPATEADRGSAAARAEGSVRGAIMLLTSGGLEIEKRLDALFAAPEPEWHGIQALADEVTQRGRETSFDLTLAALFARLAADGEAAALSGQGRRAARLARLHAEEAARFREGLAFNLDRKQMLLTHFHRRFALAGP